jgi:hypothetical protein
VLSLLAWLLFGVALVPSSSRALEVVGRCSVTFFATSTLHDFDGTAPCALLAIEPPDASGAYRARAEVEIGQMETGISARDRRMRQMFEAKRFPRITASFEGIDPEAIRTGAPGALTFRIHLHGVERSVTPALSDFSEVPGESARFRATFRLLLSDYGLERPVAMGFIRVGDEVNVVVDVELVGKNAAPAGASRAAAP